MNEITIEYLPNNAREGKHPEYHEAYIKDAEKGLTIKVLSFVGNKNEAIAEILTIRKGGFILQDSNKYILYITNHDINNDDEYKTIQLTKLPDKENVFTYSTNLHKLQSNYNYVKKGGSRRVKRRRTRNKRTRRH